MADTFPDKLALEAPVLVGLNLPGGHQLVLAPRVAWQLRVDVAGFSRPIHFLFVGASLGFA